MGYKSKTELRLGLCNGDECDIFFNRILKHPIGCVGIALPPRIKQNSSIIGLEKDNHGKQYVDNLCLFRCLGLHLDRDAMTLYTEYTDQPAREFEGITIDDLHKVETVCEVNIVLDDWESC